MGVKEVFLKEMLPQTRRVLQAKEGAQAGAGRPGTSLVDVGESHASAVLGYTWEIVDAKGEAC